ncbi:hypothetical protein HKCCE3408_08205 [Rhodobacterales bacterium HKCCE3408]|nr:hypothetical protein [Rhodobacterales bacterium HKCCE3408]
MLRLVNAFSRLRRSAESESGAMTVLGLYLFAACCCLGGIALDISHSYQMRTRLQVTADSAAHAALVRRQTMSETDAVAAAIAIVEEMMPAARYGQVVEAGDVVFGTWNAATRQFTEVPGSRNAVLIDTNQIAERANASPSYLLRIIGLDRWNIVRRSVFATYYPRCFQEGFVAEDYVDITSNNTFRRGFCVHSNGFVEMNNNNSVESGAIVSMPNRDSLVIPNSGFDRNPGLEASLRDAYYDLDVPARFERAMENASNPAAAGFPDFVTNTIVVDLNWRQPIDSTTWRPGRIHRVTCPRDTQRVRISNDTVLRDGVLLTNCEVAFGQGTTAINMRLITTSTSVDSITGANGIRIGDPDNCAPGGGSIFATRGGMRVPHGLELHGSRVIAQGDVSFAAAVNGIGGSSIVAGGNISGTANGDVGYCNGNDQPGIDDRPYFMMVF